MYHLGLSLVHRSFGAAKPIHGTFWIFVTAAALLSDIAVAQEVACPDRKGAQIIFPDGSILMRTGLAVNPDGALASYTEADHGYTYINNGVNLIENRKKISCAERGNIARCRAKWALAEAGGFDVGTPEFCVFAMDVEPLTSHAEKNPCESSKSRFVVGNGKGRPKKGGTISNVAGGSTITYVSTTTLRHTRGGKITYVDSAEIPGLVVPTSRPELVGAIAWVRYEDHEAFAIVNDTGPRFGEGSVALHQVLHTGKIGPIQTTGPIPVKLRCSAVERDLNAPFISRPELGKKDRCAPGRKTKGMADIRAYEGIAKNVTSIIFARVKVPMEGHLVKEELTPEKLAKLAADAGDTLDKVHKMAACLER